MYEFHVYVRIVYVFYLVEARVKFLKIQPWLHLAHNPNINTYFLKARELPC